MNESAERNGEVLNWLLEGANDSEEGFRQGAALARNPRLQTLFSARAQQREQLVAQIAAEVRSFEQPPTESGSALGRAHQAFTYLRDAVSKNSDKGLVAELLRRERAIAGKFQTAVDDAQLPAHARGVATTALPSFAETAEELATLDQELSGTAWENPAAAGAFQLSDDDNRLLEAPAGAAVLFAGADGTESRIARSADTVVRIGIQAVAVATSEGGSLSVAIEAGDSSSKGRDGPAPIERRLAANQSVEVLVKAGVALPFKAHATAQDAQLLRTVVWSLDVGGAAPRIDAVLSVDAAPPMAPTEPVNAAATEDIGRAPPT
jgi:uncharacterized protein (TIGR02284 family)